MCINGRPCKIVDKTESKTGKHGGKKIHFYASDIFTDQKHEHLEMSTSNIDVPTVVKNEYQLVSINDNIISYFDDSAQLQNDLFLPKSSKEDIQLAENLVNEFKNDKDIYINVIFAMGIREVKSFRIDS